MKNELELFESKKWYTIEELASLSGFTVETLKKGESPLTKLSIDFEVESRLGGYHNTRKLYSENVLKALKEYQIKNGVSNALKNKEVAIEGNISVIQNQTVKQAINNLLDNPETLNMLLQESLTRNKALGIENMQLRDIIAEQKPACEYHARLVKNNHLTNLRDTAKELQIPERQFIVALIESNWVYRDKNNKIHACADKIKDGLLEEKDWEQNGKTGVQTFVTVKGKQKLLK